MLALTKGLKYERYPFDINQSRKMRPLSEDKIEKEELSQLKVYPNPGAEQTSVEINLPENISQAQLIIYDLLGAQVFIQVIPNKETIILDTEMLTNGIYLFTLKTNEGIVAKQKVIISK